MEFTTLGLKSLRQQKIIMRLTYIYLPIAQFLIFWPLWRNPPPKKRRQSILKNSSWCVSHYWNIFIESLKSPIFPTLFLLLDVQMVAIIHYLPNLIGTSSDAVLGVDKNSSATVTAVARPEACKYFSVNVYFKSH